MYLSNFGIILLSFKKVYEFKTMIYVKVIEKETKDKGKGVFAAEFIPSGTLIWKLDKDAKRYSKDEYEKLPEIIKKDLYQEGDEFILSNGYGESWNHSCDANTWWTNDDELSARRDIQIGEEITYDYITGEIDPRIVYEWECKCGSPKCRHHLKYSDILEPSLYEEYKGHLPKWVEKEIELKRLKGL